MAVVNSSQPGFQGNHQASGMPVCEKTWLNRVKPGGGTSDLKFHAIFIGRHT